MFYSYSLHYEILCIHVATHGHSTSLIDICRCLLQSNLNADAIDFTGVLSTDG
jgi:hypothetical protein